MDEKNNLVTELIHSITHLRKIQISNMSCMNDIPHNEKIALFILNKEAKDGKVSLTLLREKIGLKPSTVTPIVNSLEEKGFVSRVIDKQDRRNIYVHITDAGRKHMENVNDMISAEVVKYIDYMGIEDTKILIKLLSKTSKYINERNSKI